MSNHLAALSWVIDTLVVSFVFRLNIILLLLLLIWEPCSSRREDGILVVLCLLLVILDCLQESFSFVSYISIFDRYHLIKVDWVLFFAKLWLTVVKSHSAWSKRIHMVTSWKLKIQSFQLILNLSVITSRPRTKFDIFWQTFKNISWHSREEIPSHVLLWNADGWSHLAENESFFLVGALVHLKLLRGWILQVAGIVEGCDCHIS